MKLDYIEVCGFRGFREKARITFGSGFTVITGRNGVGKSTLCDAVEFALTGSIGKYVVEKAAKESLSDYLWWRGEESPIDHYVAVSFKKASGETFCITRTRKSGADKAPSDIEDALCSSAKPDDALRQLCKSSIIRDEWISALSLDLSETDRFDLVRSALGPIQEADFGAKAEEVFKRVEMVHDANKFANARAHDLLENSLIHLSEAKDAIVRQEDVAAAEVILGAAMTDDIKDLTYRISWGRSILAEGRARLGGMREAISQGRTILGLRRDLDAPDAVEKREATRERLDIANKMKGEADRIVKEKERDLEIEQGANALAVSLAAIIEHGEKYGLHDEHCPLCAAARTNEEFAIGLARAHDRMKDISVGFGSAQRQMEEARRVAQQTTLEQERAQEVWIEVEKEQSRLIDLERTYIETLELYGLESRFVHDIDGLEQYFTNERNRLIDLERALHTLDASQIASKISSLEDSVSMLRREVDSTAARMENSERALESAKAMERGVRGISGDIVNERLAQISPLLNELYQRLRPHHDWRSIEYGIRGDIRRFLSLKVGDGLNPQFIFSSGQRRAAGLAFLLSVHLAREWTFWRTLILDDPIQHIDDFRAIHLIEVLAAFRLAGRQIVCAVEDSALADVLCRRLPVTSDDLGRRYNLDIGKDGAATIASECDFFPMPNGVLRS